jgi:hypothetical protein
MHTQRIDIHGGEIMLTQIVAHTPVWVWGILILLLALGLMQAKTRRLTIQRVSVVPLVMLAYSFYGCIAAFGTTDRSTLGLVAGGCSDGSFRGGTAFADWHQLRRNVA